MKFKVNDVISPGQYNPTDLFSSLWKVVTIMTDPNGYEEYGLECVQAGPHAIWKVGQRIIAPVGKVDQYDVLVQPAVSPGVIPSLGSHTQPVQNKLAALAADIAALYHKDRSVPMPKAQHKCHCPLFDLMNKGCKCGGI